MIVAFRVFGDPKPKGSRDARHSAKTGKTWTHETNPGTKPWMKQVSEEAKRVMGHEGQKHHIRPPFSGPTKVDLIFYHKRPKAHFNTKGELHWWAPSWKASRPDNDKCERAVFDALVPIVIKDDAQIVDNRARKFWCPIGMEPGVMVEVREIA